MSEPKPLWQKLVMIPPAAVVLWFCAKLIIRFDGDHEWLSFVIEGAILVAAFKASVWFLIKSIDPLAKFMVSRGRTLPPTSDL
jgi:hypothetical protein